MTPATESIADNSPTVPALTLIAAVARNGAIGRDNALLWRDAEDQRHFRRTTLGFPVIMGRKTWDSLPERFRPLPGRRNIVMTAQPEWQGAGAEAASSLEAALSILRGSGRAFVIGGAQIYGLALPLADRLVLTEIDLELDGDAFFPYFDRNRFEVVSSEPHVTSAGVVYRFVNYQLATHLDLQGT